MKELTEKQKRFCEEYLVDLNAKQAAIRAGYSTKTADRIAGQNLNKLEVKSYIEQKRAEQSERTGIKADEVINELSKIAFANVPVTGKEKVNALKLLGQHLGIFENSKNRSTEQVLDRLDSILKNIESGF